MCFSPSSVRFLTRAFRRSAVAIAIATLVLALGPLVLGSYGRTRISPKTWSALVHVWHQLGFWANSLIFLLAAMMVPESLESARWYELGLLAVMVVAALAARALVLFGLMPLLLRLGLARRISPAYKLVILWGGLRGAVSLVLALGAAWGILKTMF